MTSSHLVTLNFLETSYYLLTQTIIFLKMADSSQHTEKLLHSTAYPVTDAKPRLIYNFILPICITPGNVPEIYGDYAIL
jgi:hypothetical protein